MTEERLIRYEGLKRKVELFTRSLQEVGRHVHVDYKEKRFVRLEMEWSGCDWHGISIPVSKAEEFFGYLESLLFDYIEDLKRQMEEV